MIETTFAWPDHQDINKQCQRDPNYRPCNLLPIYGSWGVWEVRRKLIRVERAKFQRVLETTSPKAQANCVFDSWHVQLLFVALSQNSDTPAHKNDKSLDDCQVYLPCYLDLPTADSGNPQCFAIPKKVVVSHPESMGADSSHLMSKNEVVPRILFCLGSWTKWGRCYNVVSGGGPDLFQSQRDSN